jgi:hypothetical protein
MGGSFIKEADNVAKDILKDFREGIIWVGRLFLGDNKSPRRLILINYSSVSTFIEDGIRMWHQWHDHKDYIGKSWSFSDKIATFIVLVNLVGQCLCGVLVLLRILVTPRKWSTLEFEPQFVFLS